MTFLFSSIHIVGHLCTLYFDVSVEDTYLFNILNVLFLDLINLELYICHTLRVRS